LSIFGGFEELIYTSSLPGEAADPIGITTRLNPILDTSNINIRGTGRRGLYNILLGMRQPQFTIDILPTDIDFIWGYQDGQTPIPYLHYRNTTLGEGLTFTNAVFNRTSVEARHNEAISATIEVWADDITGNPGITFNVPTDFTPYRWLDSYLRIGDSDPETKWWSWRYEVNYNLQRLGNVSDGDTRAIKTRHFETTGLIVKDLTNFSEWIDLMDPDEPYFNITIKVNGSGSPGSDTWRELLNQDVCRWGRLEAPVGPEDLQAKRFPFTAINYA